MPLYYACCVCTACSWSIWSYLRRDEEQICLGTFSLSLSLARTLLVVSLLEAYTHAKHKFQFVVDRLLAYNRATLLRLTFIVSIWCTDKKGSSKQTLLHNTFSKRLLLTRFHFSKLIHFLVCFSFTDYGKEEEEEEDEKIRLYRYIRR